MFRNTTMLAGIAGAMLPLVLHLLNRARYRNVQWGAMMFLGDPQTGQNRRSRARELTLLAMRMGIVALLAVALSRPILVRAPIDGGGERLCTVIILDRSGSMNLEENGPRRIDTARRAALGTLSTLRSGDEGAIVFVPEFQSRLPQLSSDIQSLGAAITQVPLASTRADIAEALTAAARLLESSRASSKQIVLICDRQAASWRDVNENFVKNWRQSLGQAGAQVPRISIIAVGGNETGNVAIEGLQVINPPVIRNSAAEVEIRIRNYDTVPAVGLPLVVSSSEQELYRTTLNLGAGASATVRSTVKFPESGSRTLTARIISTGMVTDDAMDSAVEVTDAISVLAISGDERDQRPDVFRGETDFIRLALSPYQSAGEDGPDPVQLAVIGPDAWPVLDRQKHRVVILANAPRLSAAQARQLEQYVYGGGGLLIAPGNLVRVDDYNTQLWRDGAGALPAELESPVAADGSQATSLLGLELSHPIFHFLQGRENPLPSLTISRYFPVRASEPRGHVLGRYASGRPFMVEGVFGRGRVILMTTPLDADWSTLPLSNFYLPMMQSMIRYLSAGMQPSRNLLPGDPIVALIENVSNPVVTIERQGPIPDIASAEMLRTRDGYEARFINTNRPGRYTMRIISNNQERQIPYFVRAPRDESDLANLSATQWKSVQQSLGTEPLDSDPQAISSAMSRWRRRRELWPILLPIVIALALAELALTRFWTLEREAK